MADSKTVLIVYAHQEPKSFNGALKDAAIETLESQGHKVVVSDLYEIGFDPSASKHNFKEFDNPDHFNFQHELRQSVKKGTTPADVRAELEKVLAADLVILQTPMYWLGLPAIMKGWMDRCFAEHVFFDVEKQQWFDNGPLRHKKLVLSLTCGGTAQFFSNRSLFGDMDVLLWPIQNALRFTGFNILAPQISYAPCSASENERISMLQNWKERLASIWTDEPLKFINIKHFDSENCNQLTDKYVESALDGKEIRTSGQHLGRPLPAGCMTTVQDSVVIQKEQSTSGI